jgi:hypothetical protein
MECEIFISMLVKIADGYNPLWQRALALEVLRSLCGEPQIMRYGAPAPPMAAAPPTKRRRRYALIAHVVMSLSLSFSLSVHGGACDPRQALFPLV